jgi:hypothetical protein
MLSFNNLELVLGGKTLFDDGEWLMKHHQIMFYRQELVLNY